MDLKQHIGPSGMHADSHLGSEVRALEALVRRKQEWGQVIRERDSWREIAREAIAQLEAAETEQERE